jgi:hypothetical protein
VSLRAAAAGTGTGSGTVTTITSTGSTITVTNPGGPSVNVDIPTSYLASPPAIGGTTPNTIKATVVTAQDSPTAGTTTDGVAIINPGPAALGAQAWSPDLRFTGYGWATTGSTSQEVDWRVYNAPTQGAANPTTALTFDYQVNSGGYTTLMQLSAGPGATSQMVLTGQLNAQGVRVSGATVVLNGIYNPGTNILGFSSNGISRAFIDANGNFVFQYGTADQSKSVSVQTTGFSLAFTNAQKTLIITPAGTLATGTITMPPGPIDGQEVRFSSTQTITALTVSPNTSQTISNAPTTIAAGQGYGFIYHLAATNWYRLY